MTHKKKNILFYIGELGAGGAERVLVEVLKHLDRNKYNLSVVVNRPGGYFFDKLPEDVTLIDRSQIRRSAFDLKDRVFGLPKIIRQQKADLVVAIMITAGRSLIRVRPFVDKHVKMAVRIGNNPKKEFRNPKGAIRRWIENFEVNQIYKKADALLAISHGIKESLLKEHSTKICRIEVVHNPVDIDHVTRMKMSDDDSAMVDSDPRKCIVAIGRLVHQKGYADMLKAFQRVRDRVPSKLIILGKGPLEKELVEMIEEYNLSEDVQLEGFVENPWSYLEKADLYLSTSRFEGFHLSIVEAMACGVAPVATDCDYGPREIITDRVDGRLVPVGDIEAISDAVTELLLSSDSRKKMALNAERRAKDFDISVVVKEYERFFDSLV